MPCNYLLFFYITTIIDFLKIKYLKTRLFLTSL